MRADLRKAGRLDYALNDFDLSMLLPPDTSIETFRLPIVEIYPGVGEKPYEASCGQIDFNPFAYDVACLGIELANTFQASHVSFVFFFCRSSTCYQFSTFVHLLHSSPRS